MRMKVCGVAASLWCSLWLVSCAGMPAVERAKEMRMAGDEAYRRQEYRAAIQSYTNAIEQNPDYAEAYVRRGNAWTWLAEAPEERVDTREARLQAIADYTAAIQRNPAGYDAYFNRGVLAVTLKQYLAAVKDFLECARIRPGDPEPHQLIAQLYETRFENMGIRAMEHYEQYVRLGGADERIVEKVKAWQALRPKVEAPPSPKGPTEEEERKAAELHAQVLDLVAQGQKREAWKRMDELLVKFGHTKFVRDRAAAFMQLHRALKPEGEK
ncbi:MAG: tetratricopeptide repeat protein [Planctomycetes bacterium]|nr:tetratricopeptide repeat protein [Planctomycetota bacterium]